MFLPLGICIILIYGAWYDDTYAIIIITVFNFDVTIYSSIHSWGGIWWVVCWLFLLIRAVFWENCIWEDHYFRVLMFVNSLIITLYCVLFHFSYYLTDWLTGWLNGREVWVRAAGVHRACAGHTYGGVTNKSRLVAVLSAIYGLLQLLLLLPFHFYW